MADISMALHVTAFLVLTSSTTTNSGHCVTWNADCLELTCGNERMEKLLHLRIHNCPLVGHICRFSLLRSRACSLKPLLRHDSDVMHELRDIKISDHERTHVHKTSLTEIPDPVRIFSPGPLTLTRSIIVSERLMNCGCIIKWATLYGPPPDSEIYPSVGCFAVHPPLHILDICVCGLVMS